MFCQRGRNFAKSGRNKKKILMEPILFLYYEESLVSSYVFEIKTILVSLCQT